jgi:hypothetical protein
MANYSDDQDLIAVQQDIMSYGRDSWYELHTEAKDIIDRTVESLWYKKAAADEGKDWTETQFDADQLSAPQLKRVSVYKTLELAFLWLSNPRNPETDGYMQRSEHFGHRYEAEIRDLFALGISYDWDADDSVEVDERLRPQFRRLKRT